MIFPADDLVLERPRPTPLYAAAASLSTANLWTSVNGFAAARVFSSVEDEYKAATQGAVIADFGPLARYAIRGRESAALLMRIVTAPAHRLSVGESARGLMLDDGGGVIDLAEISRLTDDLFLMTAPTPHPRIVQLAARGLDADVETISGVVASIGVLGVSAYKALTAAGLKVPGEQIAASAVLRGVETAARPMQFGALSGIELIFPASDALVVWERLMRKGAVTPIGLDAMEILRLEGGVPRPGADFSILKPRAGERRPTPAEIGLPHLAPLDSGWFNGRRALRFRGSSQRTALITVAIDADSILPGAIVYFGGKEAGRVTSSAWAPWIRRVLATVCISLDRSRKIADISVASGTGARAAARIFETVEGRLAGEYTASEEKTTE